MRPSLRSAAGSPRRSTTLAALLLAACGPAGGGGDRVRLSFPISALGLEAEVVEKQLARYESLHPEIEVVRRVTPDDSDVQHQLYVQWLSAGTPEPDVLQIDVVWTAELAAAGWIAPLDRFAPRTEDFLEGPLAASRWGESLYALPWFADAGMLYYRTDLVPSPPRTFDELEATIARAMQGPGAPKHGLALQGARYEGLTCVFTEYLGAHGGRVLDASGAVVLDSPEAARALALLRKHIERGLVPVEALGWHEEEARFAFQRGEAVMMRNWPYAARAFADASKSAVAGRFAVTTMPAAPGGRSTAALGGALLAVNAASVHPDEAYALIAFLTAPEQMIERARIAGQLPPRRSLYQGEQLAGALPFPSKDIAAILEAAVPRPVTPLYTELSQVMQAHLHRAISGQAAPEQALAAAAAELRERIDRDGAPRPGAAEPVRANPLPMSAVAGALFALAAAALLFWRPRTFARREMRFALLSIAPAMGVLLLLVVVPLLYTGWTSLHLHDLRMPWLGRPFVGLANYQEAIGDPRFGAALLRTLFFTGVSVGAELVFGFVLALALSGTGRTRGGGLARVTALLPWAVPTVVAALIWRFLLADRPVFHSDPTWAWVPIFIADVWKTTPFVTLLLLAGLESIDPALYEAARIDGASRWQQLRYVTVPLMMPVVAVALIFRSLDAFRVFDLIFVLTNGGPGTATEPIALHTFNVLFEHLRVGYGAALAVVIFLVSLALAFLYARITRALT